MRLVTFEPEERGGAVPLDDGPARLGGAGSALSEIAPQLEALDASRLGLRRLGVLAPPGPHAGDVIDLNRALATRLALKDAGAPEAEADSLLPSEMRAFLRAGEESLSTAHDTLGWALEALERFDSPDLIAAGVIVPRRRARLCAPVLRPGKLIGVARNYRAHAEERGSEPPQEPVLFLKAVTSVNGPDAEIPLPRASREVDYEGELAVVIGRSSREIEVDEALECVAGYCAANDVSARDFQNVRGQSFIGKSCDGFTPLGPALVTRDEIDDPQDLGLRTTVSGELRQSARTKEMIFSVAEILAFASQLMTLEPGDVVLTGTPAGVGAASDPPRWLQDGDIVDVEIERIGRLRNYVRGATGA